MKTTLDKEALIHVLGLAHALLCTFNAQHVDDFGRRFRSPYKINGRKGRPPTESYKFITQALIDLGADPDEIERNRALNYYTVALEADNAGRKQEAIVCYKLFKELQSGHATIPHSVQAYDRIEELEKELKEAGE